MARGKPAGYLQAWSRIWTGTTLNKLIQLAVRVGLDLGASELQVQRSKGSATLPPVNTQSTCSYQITNILLPPFLKWKLSVSRFKKGIVVCFQSNQPLSMPYPIKLIH